MLSVKRKKSVDEKGTTNPERSPSLKASGREYKLKREFAKRD